MTLPWGQFFQTGVLALGLTPKDFWNLTFAEFWALYDGKFGPKVPPLTRDELAELEKQWVNNGNT